MIWRPVYVTKLGGLIGLNVDRAAANTSLTILSRYGVPPREQIARIAEECPTGELEFVGDLDPLDLTVYASLSSRLRRFGVVVRYLGVESTWVEHCRRHFARGHEVPVLRMSTFERTQLELLGSLSFPWRTVVGEAAASLLDPGAKLEVLFSRTIRALPATWSIATAGRPQAPARRPARARR